MNVSLSYSEIQEKIFFDWKPGVKYKTWRKGRRGGATKGAGNWVIETLLIPNTQMLWGDTVVANIQKYFERYIEPELKANRIDYTWSVQNKQLSIDNSFCDFRSADNPEMWEGFGYHYIFLNEAGIILKNRDLYVKSVLPMLMDFPNSKLIAAGVPKGKKTKNGEEHLFYTLCKRSQEQPDTYEDYVSTAHDNPFIDAESIKELEKEIFAMGGQDLVDQEVYGKFIDRAIGNTFIIHFEESRHLTYSTPNPALPLFISIDFNLTPFCLTAAHIWEDEEGHHYHRVAEIQIINGSIPAMIDAIKHNFMQWLPTLSLTGDAMGNRGELSQRDNSSYYEQIRMGLSLRKSQLHVKNNPTHENSREDVNYVFYYHPDNRISRHCEGLIFDIENVQVDAYGGIIKANRKEAKQKADFLDCERAMIHAFMKDWIRFHQKVHGKKN